VYDFFVRELALGEAVPMGISGTGTGGGGSSSSNKRARMSPNATQINEAK